MPLLVRAYPLVRPLDEVRQFAAALQARKADTDTFYRQFGVSHESWHVQDTPGGKWLISVTKVDNPAEAAPRYATSSTEFNAWFKGEVLRLSGINPDTQPLGPPTTEVFVWADEARSESNLCA